jgi:hypothetical protein
VNFEAYLISKKIDSAVFQQAEPELWKNWNEEFEQMHPASFTGQKLYLINPIRRKYPLKHVPETIEQGKETPTVVPSVTQSDAPKPTSAPKPSVPKPVFKPKPKMS